MFQKLITPMLNHTKSSYIFSGVLPFKHKILSWKVRICVKHDRRVYKLLSE